MSAVPSSRYSQKSFGERILRWRVLQFTGGCSPWFSCRLRAWKMLSEIAFGGGGGIDRRFGLAARWRGAHDNGARGAPLRGVISDGRAHVGGKEK
ncbi:hypothetical protein CEXT_246231 [Caerostris extrusa]|uniref:Uncharacterized protein n=1 Tax=Caerostris extrusa TaxID=172846 RepID=A0AAV4R8B8_CAEEX|nr:hypothetical protein CEXT_246231 [Caerostris extrusa]